MKHVLISILILSLQGCVKNNIKLNDSIVKEFKKEYGKSIVYRCYKGYLITKYAYVGLTGELHYGTELVYTSLMAPIECK